jgi:hypothetical protein
MGMAVSSSLRAPSSAHESGPRALRARSQPKLPEVGPELAAGGDSRLPSAPPQASSAGAAASAAAGRGAQPARPSRVAAT